MVVRLDRYSSRCNKEFCTTLWRDDSLTQAQRQFGTLDPYTQEKPVVDVAMSVDGFLPGFQNGAGVTLGVTNEQITYRAQVMIRQVRKFAILRCPATPWNLERIARHYETTFAQPCPPLNGSEAPTPVTPDAPKRLRYPRLYVKAGGKTR